ncbi:hypothetical protein [Haliangium ochraceum]|uniref:Uncharacterized protein n=1 Tax=Haliangium ochraceum (strain DSM 14365 / JCM 11303 / SMP-2) TaxID=502025 RepID=D0LKG2_HALO1|nr:hypothetical protein [Haliangium ochraceum]ACY15010.1 hypothetical protein Hoch_2474 [Haliangium ochraceum DSM 14365]
METTNTQFRNRRADAAYVVSSLDEHCDELVHGLLAHNTYLPADEQITPAAVRTFLRWLGATLRHQTEAMSASESVCASASTGEPSARQRRDVAAGALATELSRARNRVSSALGSSRLARYGLDQVTPSLPSERVDYGREVAERLREHACIEDDGLGGTLDTVTLAKALERAVALLDAAILEHLREIRHAQGARARRERATGRWVDVYGNGSAVFASLYRMAEQAELARQMVRPSSRRTEGPSGGQGRPGDADLARAAELAPATAAIADDGRALARVSVVVRRRRFREPKPEVGAYSLACSQPRV